MEKKELLKIVKEDGWALDDAENKFKKDKDIVLAAVTQNGTALEYADNLLKKDKDSQNAIKSDADALEFADALKDKEVVMMVVK